MVLVDTSVLIDYFKAVRTISHYKILEKLGEGGDGGKKTGLDKCAAVVVE